MTRRMVFRRRFADDLLAGISWYAARQPSLGQEFRDAVLATVDLIGTNPTLYGIIHRQVRRATLRRFPYGIFYLLEPQRIVVLRLLHSARDPKLWPGTR